MPDTALRFLIVDPLEGVRKFALGLLTDLGLAAAQVRCAASPAEALRLAEGWEPDFLITDACTQSQPDGLALYGLLRARQPQCRLGLIGFELSPELQARARGLNAQFVLSKPFSPKQLRDTLQASLDRMARERPALAARLATQSQGRLDARLGRRIELPLMALPKPLKPGEQVRYEGRTRRISAVVIRHGEQLLQLEGVSGFVPASKVSR